MIILVIVGGLALAVLLFKQGRATDQEQYYGPLS